MVLVAPSILAGDFGRLAEEVRRCERAGADRIHWDVMDGHFVPNLTFGPQAVADCREATRIEFDCHLMMTNPQDFVPLFLAAGADEIVFHVETAASDPPCPLGPTLSRVQAAGRRAGLSLRPTTPLSSIERFLPVLDAVLVMSVEPGRGGQPFLPEAVSRIRALARLRAERGYRYAIEVDGGINPETGRACVEAGADLLVAGTFLFEQDDLARGIAALRGGRGGS